MSAAERAEVDNVEPIGAREAVGSARTFVADVETWLVKQHQE